MVIQFQIIYWGLPTSETSLSKARKDAEEATELRIHEITVSYDEQREELQRELEMRDREVRYYNNILPGTTE